MDKIKQNKKLLLLTVVVLLAAMAAVAVICNIYIQKKSTSGQYQPLGEVNLIVATDLHYLSPALTDHGSFFMEMAENGDGKTLVYTEELTEAFVSGVIERKPDAMILTGDLTFNGEKKSHEDLAKKLKRVEDAGIPVLVLSGNHDLNNKRAASYTEDSYTYVDSISAEEFEEVYGDFGFKEAQAKDSASSSYIYELVPGLRILMLDVNGVKETCRVPEETLEWIEGQLQKAQRKGCRVLAFSHQNLMKHSMFDGGYVIKNSADVLKLYRKYGAVVNFTGHLHIQHVEEQDGVWEIATSALPVSPCQYGEVHLTDETLSYETKRTEVSPWIEDFDTYAKDFFIKTSYRQAMAELYQVRDEKQKEKMASYFAELNYAYFAGKLDEIKADEELEREWKETGSFIGIYIESILREKRESQNTVKINFPGLA